MKKIQKLMMSSLAAIVILTPFQAAFADDAITSLNPPVQESRNISLSGSTGSILVDFPTTDIYFNGVVTVNITGQPGGVFRIHHIDSNGYDRYLGTIIGSGSYRTQLYGYGKIYIETASYGYYIVNY